jgi:hypothetical protein
MRMLERDFKGTFTFDADVKSLPSGENEGVLLLSQTLPESSAVPELMKRHNQRVGTLPASLEPDQKTFQASGTRVAFRQLVRRGG